MLLTFGSGFQTHFKLMKQTLTKPFWDIALVLAHLPMESDDYGSVYGPIECCDNVYMVELFYFDISMYNTA